MKTEVKTNMLIQMISLSNLDIPVGLPKIAVSTYILEAAVRFVGGANYFFLRKSSIVVADVMIFGSVISSMTEILSDFRAAEKAAGNASVFETF